MEIGYGVSVGALTGSVFGSVDAIAVCALGTGVVWTIPAAIMGAYVLAGGALGLAATLLAAIWQRLRRVPTTGDELRSILRRCCLAGWVAVVAFLFAERLRHGHSEEFGGHVYPASIAVAVAVFTMSLGILGRMGIRADTPATLIVQVVCLASSAVLWESFNALYEAPIVSVGGMVAVLAYLLVWLICYAVGIRLVHRSRWIRVDGCRACLFAAAVFATGGTAAGWGIAAAQARRPIDLPYRAGAPSMTGAEQPDVILIVMDTTRADHLSVYGYHRNTTPHLAAFADEAVVYANAVSSSSWTLPAHGSLFTGLLPTEHGADLHHRPDGGEVRGLANEHLTLAEILLAQGYRTGAIMGNTAVLTRDLGFDQGFLYFDDREQLSVASADLRAAAPSRWLTGWWQHAADSGKRFNYGGRQFRYYWRLADELTNTAIDWLGRGADAPTFLFINYMDAHDPYRAHPEFAEQIGVAALRSAGATRGDGGHTARSPDLDMEMDRYDSDVAFVDAQLGRLFGFLKQAGRFDDALIIVTSDHGEAFGEHGCFGHSTSLYQEEIHIPLIIRHPGARERGIRDERISLADVPMFILGELGVPPSDAMDASRAARGDVAVAELRPGRSHGGPADGDWIMRAVITPDHVKVIESAQSDGATEIYDLVCDPLETADLRDDRMDLERITRDWLAGWTQSAHARRLAHDRHAPVDEAVRRRLAALGYLD
ncbi:MAG: sulfatase-like hydrolase/transferase [Phycisphaerales bacterium]|nr:sulfatase-like hydrolase/transferase [Phycisphaerales bacterium]